MNALNNHHLTDHGVELVWLNGQPRVRFFCLFDALRHIVRTQPSVARDVQFERVRQDGLGVWYRQGMTRFTITDLAIARERPSAYEHTTR